MSISSFLNNLSGFYDAYGASKKSVTEENSLEEGRLTTPFTLKNRSVRTLWSAHEMESKQEGLECIPKSTVCIKAEKINELIKNEFAEPISLPRGAVENPLEFYPKFEKILLQKYQDKGDQTIDVIGNASLAIIALADLENEPCSAVDLITIENLELLSSDKKANTLVKKIDPTVTKLGHAYFTSSLCRPSSSKAVVMKRSSLVRSLTGKSELCTSLVKMLSSMKEGEINLLSTRDHQKQTLGAVAKAYYSFNPSINNYLNNSPAALDLRFLTNAVSKAGCSLAQTAVAYGMPFVVFGEMMGVDYQLQSNLLIQSVVSRYIGYGGLGPVAQMMFSSNFRSVRIVSELASSAFACYNEKTTRDWVIADASIIYLLRRSLLPISQYYHQMKSVYESLKDQQALIQHFDHFSKLEDFFTASAELGEVRQFCELMESGLLRPGQILSAWRLLHSWNGKKNSTEKVVGIELKESLDKALLALAEIDCFVSIANRISNAREDGINMCIPSFVDVEVPYIDLKSLQHPRNAKNSKGIDVSLGFHAPSRSMIVTGDNNCGKTTLARSIALTLLTAKMGFCYADEATMSHFGYIRTSMKITDSGADQVGAFKAQCERGGEIRADVQGENCIVDDTNGFVVWDEPCSQTSALPGAEIVLDLAKGLQKNTRVITMIVTHFPDVAHFIGDKSDENGNVIYKNYQMAKENGENFVLKEGVFEARYENAYEIARQTGFLQSR